MRPFGRRETTRIKESSGADRWVRVAILAAGYTLTGIVGLSLAIPPGYATAVWPPSGIALAAVLLWPIRRGNAPILAEADESSHVLSASRHPIDANRPSEPKA